MAFVLTIYRRYFSKSIEFSPSPSTSDLTSESYGKYTWDTMPSSLTVSYEIASNYENEYEENLFYISGYEVSDSTFRSVYFLPNSSKSAKIIIESGDISSISIYLAIRKKGFFQKYDDDSRIEIGSSKSLKFLNETSPDINYSYISSESLPINRFHSTHSLTMGVNGTTAMGTSSLAMGTYACTIGPYSCAIGDHVMAYGKGCHAEGEHTIARGTNSHVEGYSSAALGGDSHAEGYNTYAYHTGSHAEGYATAIKGIGAHAGGKHSTRQTEYCDKESSITGDAMIIGNGTSSSSRSNCFRVTYSGAVYGLSAFNTSGADYAEFFEWHDGNPDAEDRVGLFVTLKGRKIVLANPGDYILGVTSGNPAMVGNSDEDWLGRWQKDAYDRFLKEYLEYDETLIDTTDLDEEAISELLSDPNVEMRDDQYYRRSERIVDHETPSWRYKANPNYDASKPYVERKNRPEWSYVGMMGVLSVRDDNTCEVDGYARVSSDGCATKSDIYIPGETYRVVERVEDGVVRVIVK